MRIEIDFQLTINRSINHTWSTNQLQRHLSICFQRLYFMEAMVCGAVLDNH